LISVVSAALGNGKKPVADDVIKPKNMDELRAAMSTVLGVKNVG
jgi:hypothetical protein